ncbi:beta-lactamase/transpeptidase-like protein [Trichodelitschia bisporula]|uniref:Beta-lactamase/transpeptidase-like protein n=1 Tax=Trichodelitschia bisporula TaxID=703511 RepID=A0A6G1HSU2_9PEZI|nr:beta-lactamase/transpeptidase-like protein [Trichodelitschia bisporula]
MGSITGSDFEKILSEATARDAKNVPGVVLAAIDKDGKTIYSKASGYNGVAPDAGPIDPDGTFWIASCTKLITSICALQCVEKGLVSLDEDISRILPELKDPEIASLDSSAPNGFKLTPAKNRVTLRQLLTHSSGVGYEWMNPTLQAWRKVHGPPAEELSGKIVATYSMPLLFEPGEGWMYGGGLDWAGVMVQRLNGDQSLGDYMDEHIFKPFGMNSTTFQLNQRPDIKKRVVQAATRTPDDGLVPHPKAVWLEEVHEHSGGGGLWSSVNDYIKVLHDLVKDEPTLLKKETVETLLIAPQLDPEGPAVRQLAGARGAVGANAAAADVGISYGLGGMAITKDNEFLPKNTLSWGGLPNLKWFVNRDLGVAAMYASQVLPPGDAKSTHLSSQFFKEVVRLAKEKA